MSLYAVEPNAPGITGDSATGGFTWINYRCRQAGMAAWSISIDSKQCQHADFYYLADMVQMLKSNGPQKQRSSACCRVARTGKKIEMSKKFLHTAPNPKSGWTNAHTPDRHPVRRKFDILAMVDKSIQPLGLCSMIGGVFAYSAGAPSASDYLIAGGALCMIATKIGNWWTK